MTAENCISELSCLGVYKTHTHTSLIYRLPCLPLVLWGISTYMWYCNVLLKSDGSLCHFTADKLHPLWHLLLWASFFPRWCHVIGRPCPRGWSSPGSSAGEESVCHAGDPSSIPELGRSPGEGTGCPLQCSWASLVAQLVKNPPAMRQTWVQSLGWESSLEGGTATHSVFLPGESHGQRSLAGYSPWGRREWDTTDRLSTATLEETKIQGDPSSPIKWCSVYI